ncbi:MAG TPA: FG-GAP-like repeat-containing protein, partial [Candidatus Binatia bacterium]|nr:FG-GAP-like repeat-containing protein [Candidatus Binatia bacterium]
MKTPAFGPALLALALLLLATPASAQYMYLDSNGDGVHTAADVLHAIGPTVVDIWLDTNHNRDGSVATCTSAPAEPLDMFSYVVDLTATGGTVTYSAYTNRVSEMSALYAPRPPDDTNFSTGPFVTAITANLPPGKYFLGTLTVNAVSGTPSIQIIPGSDPNIFFDITAFGSHCDGTDFPNTIALGTDWFDADGLPFGSGGMVNQTPTLSPPAGMTVPSGENAAQALTATDADGQPLTFAKSAGPAFMFVQTSDVGSGTAHGEIRLAPFASNVGSSTGTVNVTDGFSSDQKTFDITVSQSPGHAPVLFDASPLAVVAGEVGKRFLSAGDPDGGLLHFSKVSGPAYTQLSELASGMGGASAILLAAPGLCDVGSAIARIAVTDGVGQEFRDITLNVSAATARPSALLHLASLGGALGFATRIGDLNGDGKGDVVITYENLSKVTVFLGVGDGNLSPGVSYTIGAQSGDLALADLNRDGKLDIAAAQSGGSGVSVLLGRGDGTFLPATSYATGPDPLAIAVADLNHDGVPDLVTLSQPGATVSVLIGVGNGTFLPKRDSATGPQANALTVADFNLDGRPDVALASALGGGIGALVVLPGLGDGSFGNPIQTPTTGFPFSLCSGDWNGDGKTDVALVDQGSGKIRTFASRGDGTFDSPSVVATLSLPFGCSETDLNGDGNPDLAVTDPIEDETAVLLGNGVGGFGSVIKVQGFLGISLALGDMNSDGRPDFVSASPGGVAVLLNRFGPANPAEALAFVQGGQAVPASSGNNDVAILLEPLHGSYTSDLLNFGSVTLSSVGTGSVSLIHSIASKRFVEADRDRDGVPEVEIDFARADFTRLFDQVHGRTTASADLAGSLTDGRAFCTDVALTIVGTGQPQQVVFAPNPLNPQSKLSFTTEREGPARALLFD